MEWVYNLKVNRKLMFLSIIELILFIIIGYIGIYNRQVSLLQIISVILVLTFLAILLSQFASFIITNPIASIADRIKKVASGNLEVNPVEFKSSDEIGELSSAFNEMTENLHIQVNKELKLAKGEKLLKQIMMASVSLPDIKSTLSTIVTATGQVFSADRCFFMDYDNKAGEYQPIKDYEVYVSSFRIKNIAGVKFTKEEVEPFLKITIQQKEVLAVDNVDKIELPDVTRKLMDDYGVKSFISVPIVYKDNIIGTLMVQYVEDYRQFTQDDIDILSAIASQSAIVINHAQLYSKIKESKNREELIKSIVSRTLTSENLEEAIDNITSEIGKAFNADRVNYRPYNEEIHTFSEVIAEYRRNENIPSVKGMMIFPKDYSQYLFNELFINKEILFIDDISDPKYPESYRKLYKSLDIKNQIVLPVHYKNQPEGAFFITNTETIRMWEKEDLEFLLPIFQQISIGTHLFEINNRLSKALASERILREIISEVRRSNDPNTVFSYLIYRLSGIFNIDRVLHLKHETTNNLIVCDEELGREDLGRLLNQIIFYEKDFIELSQNIESQIIVINDINDIQITELKNRLKGWNIEAFLLYPITEIIPETKEAKITDRIIICSSFPRKWNPDEVESLKLIVGAISVVYIEIRKRLEIEELRDTYIGTLTHDLRSPILAEQKALEFIKFVKPETPIRDYLEYLEDMYTTNEELLRIINNILAVQHYESGKAGLKIELANIKNVIDDSINSLKPLAQEQDSKITIDIAEDLPLVKADKAEIGRVITNLISNAIKHTRKGTEINVSANRTDHELQVAVADNGEGIPEAERTKIFQRYPTAKRQIGTGLGLYLSKQIIEAHKGKIWFETEVGKGTTFYFTLPIS